MAGVTTYSCTRCRPIDTEIIEAYQILTNTSKQVSAQEADRVTAEQGRVTAENERERVFGLDHGTATDDHATAVSDHGIAGDDHLLAVADHGTAGDDHTIAAGDHVTAGEDHLASTSATSRANDAAAAAEHMVDIHTGPEGKSAYEVAVENGYVGTEEEWLASLEGPVGVTPDISIGTVTTVEPGTPAAASMGGTPEAPVLNLSIPKGLVGATPNITVGTVTTGEPGTPVVVTITGTPEAPVLNLTIPQGMQGNTGSSVEYPYELVNNLTTNDATKGLSAAQGYVLDGKVSQLEHEVHNLSGKYYGLFTSSANLPEGDTPGYAFVGSEAPFAIWNFDGDEWADTGATIDSVQGDPGADGIGVGSVYSSGDGTMVILLTNGDTITLDLNHNHEGYYSKVLGGAMPVGGFLPDVVYSLGTLSGTITFSLASPVTGNVNHYFWMFDTSTTAPTISWPSGITWADGSAPTVQASKHYEISVLNGIAYYSEV